MSLRTRLTLAAGGAVMVALVVASVVVYTSVRSKLLEQIDASLITGAQNVSAKLAAVGSKAPTASPEITSLSGGGKAELIPSVAGAKKLAARKAREALVPPAKLGQTDTGAVVTPEPKVSTPPSTMFGLLPLDKADTAVANGQQSGALRDIVYGGQRLRVYSVRFPGSTDGLIRAYRPLSETTATIHRVELILIALTLGGAVVAALLGRLAAAAVLRPVRTLADAVQGVTNTRDLRQRIPAGGRDEVGSLARNFNAMLAALDESHRAQQQLIADASHELRTPLTAHRANVELLARRDLPPERRPHVLAAAVRGIEDLSTLVGDLIQAARNGRSVDARAPVALDELVAAAVDRAKHRAGGLDFDLRLEPYTVSAARARVERAVDNVLDNAVKWSRPCATIEVTLVDGLLTVRDHGPGFEDADLPHVFDRFYRAASARGQPGSGLGLAIVKQTVEDHGGGVVAANAEGGGAALLLRFDARA